MNVEIKINKTVDGMILIKKINNCLRDIEIKIESREVYRLYFDHNLPFYYKNVDDGCNINNNGENIIISEGSVITPEEFEEIVKIMDKAGRRLSDIRRIVKGYMEETIII